MYAMEIDITNQGFLFGDLVYRHISRFLHIVACSCRLYILIAIEFSTVWIYHSNLPILLYIDSWVVSTFDYYK